MPHNEIRDNDRWAIRNTAKAHPLKLYSTCPCGVEIHSLDTWIDHIFQEADK